MGLRRYFLSIDDKKEPRSRIPDSQTKYLRNRISLTIR
nr:MAG TPA: hypothetical protein [Caudoviricetes sp.]